jgi:hypothetical protein
MPEARVPLSVVDARMLPQEVRSALAPGDTRLDETGSLRELPRFFYRIDSWEHAMGVRLTPNFGLWEFIQTDVRENPVLQSFPRYVPCALTLVALALEQFRIATGTFVHIAANGGYRSPTHALNMERASTHCWGTAVNVYKVGDTCLDSRSAIAEYAAVAQEAIPAVWSRPYGSERGEADDHLHIDLGYILAVPRDAHPARLGEATP